MPTAQCNSAAGRTQLLRRIGASAIVSAASAATLLGLDGTAAAAVPAQQSMRDVPESVEEDSTVTFSGTLTGFNDRPLAGEEVKLQRDIGDGWSTVKTEQTDADGKVSIPAQITRTAEWRLSFAGDQMHDADSSESDKVTAREPISERIVEAAAAQEGDPYSYGAEGPDSFDCSGLTKYAHDQVGIELPRTSSEQADSVQEVDKSDRQPGDLIFFDDGGGVYHVAIYAGNDQVWTAPQEGETVKKDDIWSDSYTVGRAW